MRKKLIRNLVYVWMMIFMISLYSGTPGSGKSLHLADKMYCHLKYGKKPIIANFGFNVNYIKLRGHASFTEVNNLQLTPDYLYEYSEQLRQSLGWRQLPEDYILLCIDECQILFNSREWNSKNRAGWLSFFTQHRKLGYQIILIAQFDRMIDRQIRALIEYEYIHRKVGNFGVFGAFLNVLCMGKLFVYVKVWYPLGDKVGSEFFRGKKKLFRLYNSYTMFDSPG